MTSHLIPSSRSVGIFCVLLNFFFLFYIWMSFTPVQHMFSYKAGKVEPQHVNWNAVPVAWQREIMTRRNQLTTMCKRHKMAANYDTLAIRDILTPFLWVDDRHGLIYCEVPKVGCTNMIRLMYALTRNVDPKLYQTLNGGLVHASYRKYLVPLWKFSDYGIRFRLENYLKVMSVRHPLERLVSAYRSKLEKGNNRYYSRTVGQAIARNFKLNETVDGRKVSFTQFVRFLILTLKQVDKSVDRHWRTYDKLCNPCDVKYDVIGRYETLDRDMNMALRMLGAGDTFQYPTSNMSAVSSADVWKAYYTNSSLTEIDTLWKFYEMDGFLFNYTLNELTSSRKNTL